MTTEGLQALGATLALMDAPYGNVWTDAKIALYQTALKNVPDAAALAALERIALTRPLRPAPSEILEEIARLTDPAPSLAGAIEQIRDKFFRNKTVFLHPAVEKMTDAMGGPSVIGRMEDFAQRAARIYDKCVKEDREQTAAFIAAGIVAPSLPTGTAANPSYLPVQASTPALPGVSPSGGFPCAAGDCDSIANLKETALEDAVISAFEGDADDYDYAADDLAFDAARERGR